MPASVSIGYALWMDGATFNGLLGRQAHIAAGFLNGNLAQVTSGVMPSGGSLAVSNGSGMSVIVGTGYAVIASSAGSTFGGYSCASMTTQALAIATADLVNPRIDLVCATVIDLGTSGSSWELQVITGIPAGSPSVPATPSNSLPLCQVLVPANATSIVAGDLTDVRTFVAAQGGIVPVRDLAASLTPLTGYHGMYVHDRSTSRFARYEFGNTVVQPVLLPFTPQLATKTSTLSGSGTVCSVTVTTDGNTDLEIHISWPGLYCNNSAAFGAYGAGLKVEVDGSPIREVDIPAGSNTATLGGGSPDGRGWARPHHQVRH